VRHDARHYRKRLSGFWATRNYDAARGGCAAVTSRLGWEEPVREMEALYATLASTTSRERRI